MQKMAHILLLQFSSKLIKQLYSLNFEEYVILFNGYVWKVICTFDYRVVSYR